MKQKIAFIIPTLDNIGGAEKICSIIGTELNNKGYNTHYFTFYNQKQKCNFKGFFNTLNENKSNNIFINIWKLLKRSYSIKQYCYKNNIKTSISFMEEANFSNILSKILFGNKAKIIISIRNNINKKSFIYKGLIKILYNYSNIIVTIVNEEKNNLIVNFGIKKDKIKVINNTVNYNEIQNKLYNTNLGSYEKLFKNGKFTFINIGKLTYQKNHTLLIQTFLKFNNKYPSSQLIIIGEGELKDKLKKIAGNNKNIFFTGIQTNPYIFFKKADSFILTSKYEGMPGVLLEALTCQLPIISSDCSTGPCEILKKDGNFNKVKSLEVEKFGLLFPEGDSKELFKAMEKMYTDKQLIKSLQKRSLERIQNFSLNKIIEKWEEII